MSALRYRPDIDGLRAIAVLCVIIFHLNSAYASGGYIGVDVFFVISGYLITSIIQKDMTAGTFTLIGFWERRLRRIMPALFLVMVSCFFIGWFLLLPEDYKNLAQQGAAVTTFSSNILFFMQSGYFDSSNETKPLLHTWSLGIEEQFYLLFPPALLLIHKFFISRLKRILIALFCVSFALSLYGVIHYPSATFYLLPTRAWELLLGSLLAYTTSPHPGQKRLTGILSVLGLAFILVPAFFYKNDTPFPGFFALIPCCGAALIIWCGNASPSPLHKVLSLKPVVFIGKISYSWYLWHWPAIVFYKYYYDDALGHYDAAIIFFGTFIISAASWKYIETPLRKSKPTQQNPLFAKKSTIFFYSLITSGLILGTSAYIYFSGGKPDRLSPSAALLAGGQRDFNTRRDECHNMTFSRLRETKGCLLGEKTSPVSTLSFFAYGDSFMDTLAPALDRLAQDHNLHGSYATYSSCPPVFDIRRTNQLDNPGEHDCRGFNNTIKELIDRNSIRNVIWFARWNGYTTKFLVADDETAPENIQDSVKLFKKHIYESAKYFSDRKVNLYIITQPPEYDINVPQSLAKAAMTHKNTSNFGLSQESYIKQRAMTDDLFTSIHSLPHVTIIDVSGLFCETGASHCRIEHNGYSLYRDTNHLSTQGAYYLAPALNDFMRNMDIQASRNR